MSKTQNITEIVRSFAAAKGTLTKKDARQSLNLSIDKVSHAFATLINQGYLRRIKHGLYQFSEFVEKPGARINDKIWKAMKISPTFSAGEIAKLTGSRINSVHKQFRKFRADKYIKSAGMRTIHGGGQEKVWRLTQKGKAKAQNPCVESYKPDPLVMAVVNLNRLICSGLAVRDQESADMAMKFLEEIRKGLEDAATS